MPTAHGKVQYAFYGTETTYGTPVTANQLIGLIRSANVDHNRNQIRSVAAGARNTQSFIPGSFEERITLEWEPTDANFWKFAMGSLATTGAGPYTHTITEAASLSSFTLEVGWELGATDYVEKIQGCKIDSLTINYAVGEPVTCSATIFGQKSVKGTTAQAVANPSDAPYYFSQGTLTENGNAVGQHQGGSITLSNNLKEVRAMGSNFNQAILEAGDRQYEHSANVAVQTEEIGMMEDALGAASANSPSATNTLFNTTMVFDNGLGTTLQRKITLTLTGEVGNVIGIKGPYDDMAIWEYALLPTSSGVVFINNTASYT